MVWMSAAVCLACVAAVMGGRIFTLLMIGGEASRLAEGSLFDIVSGGIPPSSPTRKGPTSILTEMPASDKEEEEGDEELGLGSPEAKHDGGGGDGAAGETSWFFDSSVDAPYQLDPAHFTMGGSVEPRFRSKGPQW